MSDFAHHLLLVYMAYFVAVASPGPSTMSIMGVAMSQGRGPAIAIAMGVVTGIFCWALLAATGISAILIAYAELIFVIKLAGGAYLLFLAWKAGKSAFATEDRPVQILQHASMQSLYRTGVLIHLTNPKAILGWIAIMSLGLKADAPPYMLPAILLGCVCIGFWVNLAYAVMFSTAAVGRLYRKSRPWIEATLAVVFGYAGLRLLLSRH